MQLILHDICQTRLAIFNEFKQNINEKNPIYFVKITQIREIDHTSLSIMGLTSDKITKCNII